MVAEVNELEQSRAKPLDLRRANSRCLLPQPRHNRRIEGKVGRDRRRDFAAVLQANAAMLGVACGSAFNFDPASASNVDPFHRERPRSFKSLLKARGQPWTRKGVNLASGSTRVRLHGQPRPLPRLRHDPPEAVPRESRAALGAKEVLGLGDRADSLASRGRALYLTSRHPDPAAPLSGARCGTG